MEQPKIVTAYPDLVEPVWKQQSAQGSPYRTNSYTSPVQEAVGFVIKYSLWFVLSIVISVGLAMRWRLDTGTGLIVWGMIATGGYIAIFFLLSVFTPEGVALVNQLMNGVSEYFAFRRYEVYAQTSQVIELRKLELRHAAARQIEQVAESDPVRPSMELPVFAWRQPSDFVGSITNELPLRSTDGESEAYDILVDFVADLYDNAEELLRDGEYINMQAGVTLPWSKRSDVSAPVKAEMKSIVDRLDPPLFVELSNGRVWRMNTKDYPTKQQAIEAIGV